MQAHSSSPLRCATPCLPSSSWCSAAHPIILPWHCSIIFIVWRCTSYLLGVALRIPSSSRGTTVLNHFSCVALHIPSSWCGAVHPFILPWHYSIIFLVWRCTSHLLGVALRIPSSWCGAAHPFILLWHCSIIFLLRRCTSCHPPVALLNNFSCVALHIPSSGCGAAHPFILPWYCSIIFLVLRCTSHLSGVALHIPSSSRGTTQ